MNRNLDLNRDLIIETGCLKLIDWVLTGNKFHQYNKPYKTKIRSESEKIFCLSNQYLSKFGTFKDEINRFMAFIFNFDVLLLKKGSFWI